MRTTKLDKKTILSFIAYYKLQNDANKATLRKFVIEECDFSSTTFFYKLRNHNYDKLEIAVLIKALKIKFK